MFLVDTLDAAVHVLSNAIGKPDGNDIIVFTWFRLIETDVVFVCRLSLRLDYEELCQGKISASPLCYHIRHNTAGIHV